MPPLVHHYSKFEKGLFFLWLALVASFFFWSRLDFSDRVYYSPDGDVVVGLIQLILQSHDWDASWNRVIENIHVPEEIKAFIIPPDLSKKFYNLSGYTVIGAVFCKIIYAFNLVHFSIQKNIHFLNVLFQLSTLYLLFSIGQKIFNRYVGLLAALFFTISPLAITEAHYERPEAWLCLLGTAILYCSVTFEKAPKRNAVYIGALIGLSIVNKFTQIFLGIIPAILLANHFFAASNGNFKKNLADTLAYGLIILVSIIVSAFINTPFIFENFSDYLFTIPEMQKIYITAAYPFATEHYSFFQQLGVVLYYFYMTLGAGWLFCLALGAISALMPTVASRKMGYALGLIIILPIAFLVLLFSLQVNFIERNFASVVGLISLLSAIGFYSFVLYLKTTIRSKLLGYLIIALLAIIVFYPSSRLGFLFVKNHIKQPGYKERIVFQNELKKDFSGFWIKNIFITFNILNKLPEPLDKPPRIYHVEDLNEYSTRDYLINLKNNGFIPVAEYCSDFYNLPPSDFTIYHTRARNHYFIKNDQWPHDVPPDYFKTNCQ